ncbi:MAG: F0F1 ATP synthase subunit A [Thermoguttaceae bacterium]|nr:F0F1 ATP synthase subunit A [Thermoguttaceae bacterium]MDW8039397.1 F0F1 ATP synthase subunit A [Thermoguttaceae bacterium]
MIDLNQVAHHISDSNSFHIPVVLWQMLPEWFRGADSPPGQILLPAIGPLQLTRFMVLEVVAGLMMVGVFVPLARRMSRGGPPRGVFWNLLESMLVFIRDRVARPAIGHHADQFLPYLWTAFFFILFCNLLGLVPWAGSPTGSLAVTGTLAAISLGMVLTTGIFLHGLKGYVAQLVPSMEIPGLLAMIMKPTMVMVELLGLGIRHAVLAVRLLANMFAGHMVLAVVVSFITAAAQTALWVWLGVCVGSILGAVGLTLLEILVALLQAYIFTFLSALFIGMSVRGH